MLCYNYNGDDMETKKIIVNGEEIDFVMKVDEDYFERHLDFDDEDTLDLSKEVNFIKEMESESNEW